jgi:hypothetical protein
MWRAVCQRLGLGYIILLPALAFIGVSAQHGVDFLCFEFGPRLEEMTGRGLHNTGRAEGDTIWWLAMHPTSNLLIMLLPWWIGAWALLRGREPLSPHDYWKVIHSVSNAVILYLAVLTFCFFSILRRLYLGAYVVNSTPLSCGIGIAFFVFVVLVVAAVFRLRTRIPNK